MFFMLILHSLHVCTHIHHLASAATAGSLQILSSNGQAVGGPFVFFNRIGIMEGSPASPNYDIGHVGDNVTNYAIPDVTWLKDGEVTRATPTDTPLGSGNGQLRTTLTFTMMLSDAGVYQCVVNDTARSELFVTVPIKIDTGDYLVLMFLPYHYCLF